MPGRLTLRRAARPRTPCVVPRVDLGVNGHVSRERDLLLTGDELDRREEARRPTGGEQLLGVGAGARAAGRRKLDVEPAIVAVGGAAVPTTRGVRFRGVQDFFKGHDSLLAKQVWYESSTSCASLPRQSPTRLASR